MGYATAWPLIFTDITTSLSWTNVDFEGATNCGAPSGLNIHSKWFCRANQAPATTGTSGRITSARLHQRRERRNVQIASRLDATANPSVTFGAYVRASSAHC